MKFCTQQQILNWMNVTWSKMKKLHWTDSEFDRTLSCSRCFYSCRACMYRNVLNSLVVTTLQSNHSTLDQPLVISLILNDGTRLATNFTFVYRRDPRFKNIKPTNHLIVYVLCMKQRYCKFWQRTDVQHVNSCTNVGNISSSINVPI